MRSSDFREESWRRRARRRPHVGPAAWLLWPRLFVQLCGRMNEQAEGGARGRRGSAGSTRGWWSPRSCSGHSFSRRNWEGPAPRGASLQHPHPESRPHSTGATRAWACGREPSGGRRAASRRPSLPQGPASPRLRCWWLAWSDPRRRRCSRGRERLHPHRVASRVTRGDGRPPRPCVVLGSGTFRWAGCGG